MCNHLHDMHFDDDESALLRKWIIHKLEDISDADSDVLADYVLALIRNDDSEPVAKANSIENLRDFLPNNVESFVNDVFVAIATKAYDPSSLPLKPTAPVFEPFKRSSFDAPSLPNESRKRSYHDWDRDEPQQGGRHRTFAGDDRPSKQPRRGGGRGGFTQRGGRSAQTTLQPLYQAQHPLLQGQMPIPPPGMPTFDPNNSLAALLAMQQAMGILPGFASNNTAPLTSESRNRRPTQRCRDYDLKGFCSRGASCPYEHGENPYVVPQLNNEYDPQNARMFDIRPSRTGQLDKTANGRGSGKGRGRGAGRSRAGKQSVSFSHSGVNHDRAITSIVVEQIPEESFDEQTICDFFGEFGAIADVKMQPYKRLAIITYDSYDAARAAYDSPMAVFDNRFVKVYWHRPSTTSRATNGYVEIPEAYTSSQNIEMQEQESGYDSDAFMRRQEQAQRKHVEAKKRREDIEKLRTELEDRLKTMEEERQKVIALLAKKTGKPVEEQAQESEQTKALKVQLAKLEAEAKSLGIDPEDAVRGYQGLASYRGRGGHRGRGRGGGRYSRGGWVGAGGHAGAVMRLDNRPKTVCIAFKDGHYDDHDEALRQYLMLSSMDTATLSKHPGRDDAALVAFPQRYEGENLIAAVARSVVPHIGKVELAWYAPHSRTVAASDDDDSSSDIDIKTELAQPHPAARQDDEALRDMDTYDETDDYS